MRAVAERLEDKVRSIDLFREGHQSGVQAKYEDDPKFQYFLSCTEDREVVLPVLQYVHNKTLCLQSYTLSIGHAKALARACELFESEGINRVIFDNCGVDDEEFAQVLQGIAQLRDFKKIIYR